MSSREDIYTSSNVLQPPAMTALCLICWWEKCTKIIVLQMDINSRRKWDLLSLGDECSSRKNCLHHNKGMIVVAQKTPECLSLYVYCLHHTELVPFLIGLLPFIFLLQLLLMLFLPLDCLMSCCFSLSGRAYWTSKVGSVLHCTKDRLFHFLDSGDLRHSGVCCIVDQSTWSS